MKRALALTMALMMAVALVACGGGLSKENKAAIDAELK